MYRLYTPISRQVRSAPVAATRIPIPSPTANIRPAVAARRSPPTDNASICSQLSQMSISKPSSASRPAISSKAKECAAARAQQRKDAVVAKLGLPSITRRSSCRPRSPPSPPLPPPSPPLPPPSPPLPLPTRPLSPPSPPHVPLRPLPPSATLRPPPRSCLKGASTSTTSTSTMSSRATLDTKVFPSTQDLSPPAYSVQLCRRRHIVHFAWRQSQSGLSQSIPIQTFVGIQDRSFPPSRIPSPRVRGSKPYCPARRYNASRDWHGYHPVHLGRPCDCHGDVPSRKFHRHPREWGSTPSEADVIDEHRPRRVQFSEEVAFDSFERWYLDTYGYPDELTDFSTSSDDDAAIQAIDLAAQTNLAAQTTMPAPTISAASTASTSQANDLAVQTNLAAQNTTPAPTTSTASTASTRQDFNSMWQEMMDEGFPDDDE